MTDPADIPDVTPADPEPPRKKGHPILAWIGILVFVVVAVRHDWRSRFADGGADATQQAGSLLVLRLQGRYVVGAAGMFGPKERAQMYEQLKSLDTGPLDQRLRFIVLAGELAGPEEALQRLHDLRAKLDTDEVKGKPEDVALVGVLEHLYRDYQEGHLDAPSVSAVERERLRERLGWFGQLALAPRDGPDREARAAVVAPAQRTALLILVGVCTLIAVGAFGFTGLVILLVMLFLGRLRPGLTGPFEYGGVYAETFALWMGLFLWFSFLASRVDLPGPGLLLAGAVPLASWALALCWPLLRGVPFRRLREDAGLTLGRNPPLEPALGVVGYALSLPILGVGVLLILAAMHLQQSWYAAHPDAGPPPGPPTHPIVQVLGNPDWRLLVQLLLLASVMAPIVEETMFRGLLYRHLREATGHWGRFTSALFSAFVVSFVFAVIHPQGWLGIPALMGLALGFSLLREWRGTLIPSMVAHGLNNGLLLLFLYFALVG